MKDKRIGKKKQKLHRSKLTIEALKWDYFGWSMTVFDKTTAFWKWQSELCAQFVKDSEGKYVASWYRYHGYKQIKNLKILMVKLKTIASKWDLLELHTVIFDQVRAYETFNSSSDTFC